MEPPPSPDLFMCNIFLWNHPNADLFREKSRTLEESKAAIRNPNLMNQRTNTRQSEAKHSEWRTCVRDYGRHLGDVNLFNTVNRVDVFFF